MNFTALALFSLALAPGVSRAESSSRVVAFCGNYDDTSDTITATVNLPRKIGFDLWPVRSDLKLEVDTGRVYDPNDCTDHPVPFNPDNPGSHCDEWGISDQYASRGCYALRSTDVVVASLLGKTFRSRDWTLGDGGTAWNTPGGNYGDDDPYFVCDGGLAGMKKVGHDLDQKGGVRVTKEIFATLADYRARGIKAFDMGYGMSLPLIAADGQKIKVTLHFDSHGDVAIDSFSGTRRVNTIFGPSDSSFFCLVH